MQISICSWILYLLTLLQHVKMQIENYNKPFLDALSQYDDGQDLSDYDFNQDGCSSPHDDLNKRKLAYRHRIIAHKYKQVFITLNDQISKFSFFLWMYTPFWGGDVEIDKDAVSPSQWKAFFCDVHEQRVKFWKDRWYWKPFFLDSWVIGKWKM